MSEARYRSAIALSYDTNGEHAPSVAIKATHLAADELVEIAHRYKIPVIEQGCLAAALLKLEQDQSIPPELFHVVATVFAKVSTHTLGTRNLAPLKTTL